MEGGSGSHVVNVLHQTLSSDSETLCSAQQKLLKWEAEAGFYSELMRIFTNKNNDVNVRWQAILYVKNGVERNWRRHSPTAIKEDEKIGIRSMLLENFHEPANQLATQLAVVIGKIARLDCPKEWPELLGTLMNALASETDQLRLQRILLSFYQVIKGLSSKRLAHDRKVFEELTMNIFDTIVGLWDNQMSQFGSILGEGDINSAHVMLQYAHLTLKVLRKLVIFGFKSKTMTESAMKFVHTCFYGIQNMLRAGSHYPGLINQSETWNKILLLYTKILLDMLNYHPERYVDCIESSLELVCNLCFKEMPAKGTCERFTVNLLNIMKDILNSDSYRPPNIRGNDENGFPMKAHKTIRAAMTSSILKDILKVLVYNYLLLSADDLRLWTEDPEEYVNEEGGDSYKYTIHACVETLLATLFREFKPVLCDVLLDMVKETETTIDVNNMKAILTRDALYNAFGLAAYDIYDEVDFDYRLHRYLSTELDETHPNYRIVKRRVVWVIGKWVAVKLSTSSRPIVYELILRLLDRAEDLVVRIEAALTLQAAVDDFEFSYAQFAPYLERSFILLLQLLSDVHSCDSKMKILYVMSFIIEKSGKEIAPHCQVLIQCLPALWQQSEQHNMLRCAIVSTLTSLVRGLSSESHQLSHIVLPVIELSTDTSQPAHVYLFEDGLELWLTVLQNSVECTPPLLQLFKAIPVIIDLSTENLKCCLKIIESYALLSAQSLFLQFGNMLVDSLCSLVTDIKSEGLIMVLRVVETFFKLLPNESSQLFKKLFIEWIIPSVLDGESYPMVMSLYLCLVSRLIMNSQQLFLLYLAEYSHTHHYQEADVLREFLRTWFESLDCISQSERRKICALAIATLIPTGLGAAAEGLDPMVNACVQVMHDICTSMSVEGKLIVTDTAYLDPEDPTQVTELTYNNMHEQRKQEVSKRDLVFNIKLHEFVYSKLGELCTMIGEGGYQQLMSTIDQDIISQLQNFMTF
ncbi:importin-11-like [Watersipora subatra]|uniref:importin-11-like n=1 Tax=Watersipora subatra TaxID=2589382 RepID=UPI00355B1A36